MLHLEVMAMKDLKLFSLFESILYTILRGAGRL